MGAALSSCLGREDLGLDEAVDFRRQLGLDGVDALPRLLLGEEDPVSAALAVDRHAFASGLPGCAIDARHRLGRGLAGDVQGGADALVNVLLERGLEGNPRVGRDLVGGEEGVGKGVGLLALRDLAVAGDQGVLDGELALGEGLAPADVLEREDGFDPRRDPGERRAGADRWDGEEGDVAEAVRAHHVEQLGGEVLEEGAVEVPVALEEGEGPLLACQGDAGAVGDMFDVAEKAVGEVHGLVGVVADAELDEEVGEAGEAHPDAAGGQAGLALGGEGVPVGVVVQDVVEEADGVVYGPHEFKHRDLGLGGEGVLDEGGEVHVGQGAVVMRALRDLRAGVGRDDLHARRTRRCSPA